MELSLKDILTRPHFREATLFAGKNGLDRNVKWVHIVEQTNFGHLLNGQEIILTTGMNWINDETKSIHFLQQLLDHEVAALCIELFDQSTPLPQKMLDIANKHDFPIITFNKEVRFVDITKDLHEVILNSQESSWWELDTFYKKLNHTLITNGSIGDFLKLLHKATNKQVALIHHEGDCKFFPSPSKTKQQQLANELKQENTLYNAYPIYFLDKPIAHLYLIDKPESIALFDNLSARRCSEFLEQYFWKHYQEVEIKQIKENEWLLEALQGKLEEKQIAEKFEDQSVKLKEAVIGVIPNKDETLSEEAGKDAVSGVIMPLRVIFEHAGFYFITSNKQPDNHDMFLLINQEEGSTIYQRLNKAIQRMRKLKSGPIDYGNLKLASFGEVVHNYEQLPLSYQTALATLTYQQTMKHLPEPLYKNVGVYRFIKQINDNELRKIIQTYIGPLLAFDQENGTELVKTLHVYLKHLGSKNDTAKELYIVRQTLYNRLNRIAKLIGKDFLNHEKRMMIELAIHAEEYFGKVEAGV